MRLLRLEMKRVLKTKSTMILLFLALLLSFLMAWLPVTFCQNSYTDENGNTVKLSGLKSIQYEKELQEDVAGMVTSEKVRQAVENYQSCLKNMVWKSLTICRKEYINRKSYRMPRFYMV